MSVTVRFEFVFDDAGDANKFVQNMQGPFQFTPDRKEPTFAEEYARRSAPSSERERSLLSYYEAKVKAKMESQSQNFSSTKDQKTSTNQNKTAESKR